MIHAHVVAADLNGRRALVLYCQDGVTVVFGEECNGWIKVTPGDVNRFSFSRFPELIELHRDGYWDHSLLAAVIGTAATMKGL